MGTDYNHEVGYETLRKDFKRYQSETPKGVSLQNKRNKTIILKFKINGKPKSKGCNCTFSLDGMVEALSKAKKVAEALKSFDSETKFWEWYDSEILDKSKIVNDQLTFGEAIKKVEDNFWSRPDRRKRKRDKKNPSHQSSWRETYGRFFDYLPKDKLVNSIDIIKATERQKKGTKVYKHVVSAFKKLVRIINRQDIYDDLNNWNITQTEYKALSSITLEDFL